jgi:hypothetical protein
MRTIKGGTAVKKVLCGILAGILIFFNLISCDSGQTSATDGTEPVETEIGPEYDLYVYRMEEGAIGWNQPGIPFKVNLVSGRTTPVCTDPLCMHDTEECPFYECNGCSVDGEILFYRRGMLTRDENGNTGTEKLCACHVAEGKTRILREYADSLIFLGVRRDMLYYYTAEWGMEESDFVCTYRLHRADGKSGSVEDLSLPGTYRTVGGYIDTRDYPRILTFDEDGIWWTKTAEDLTTAIFRSGLDGENWTEIKTGVRTPASVYSEGYGYFLGISVELTDPGNRREGDGSTVTYSLSRAKLDSEEEPERIADDIGSSNFLVTDRYIFTMEGALPVPEGLKVKTDPFSWGAESGTEILNGCRIWRMDLNGNERTLVGETTEYFFARRQGVSDRVLFDYYEDGENTWLAFFLMERDESGRLVPSEDTLILNTGTGEFTVSEFAG